ncbi:ubiquitin-associated domain-containing protein 1-like [Ctenocephalides felis]|uniref:ubiquitin-associated domain-containing protein 1-like n=1 Tax=Ctenocephalides felis TaxID=7515 RepID=UPI000E6E24B5|nr:ubiquitin-associated domain-containing protein 1-like [Ctenocephalides felis]
MAVAHFNADPSVSYRLLLVRTRKPLRESRSLEQEGVLDGDEALMNVSREEVVRTADSQRGPQEQEIAQATAHIQSNQPKPPLAANIEEMVATSELQLEMRKILISLAEHSARALSAGPSAARVARMLCQRLSSSRRPDPRSLQGLVDMGFSAPAATRALRQHNGDAALALEALLGEQGQTSTTTTDATATTNATDTATATQDAAATTTTGGVSPRDDDVDSLDEEAKKLYSEEALSKLKPVDYCGLLLALVRGHASRDFQPHAAHMRELIAMGFPERDCEEALRVTGNNHPAACEWLVGGRTRSLYELREGLSPESPVLAALMESPQVQLSLSNPKMLLAYLSMLDSHAALNMWLNDPEASPILSHILRTYHAEKHALAVNQFSAEQNS